MPPHDLDITYSTNNLNRAWKWIKSNPNPGYKNYFRPIYTSYAAAENSYIKSLQRRLKSKTYSPSSVTKIFVPKPSGILRPITLLSVEDQIVYQAFANQIAIKLNRRIRKRYFKKIYGNIYAGSNSTWFYQDWHSAYSKYNKAIKKAISSGHNYAASFDLTACYDSIDHKVLKHFLTQLKFSQEFIIDFINFLEAWTAINQNDKKERIYLGHGIPQGPLSSGIISELILQVFDNNKFIPKNVIYMRYVDDIRLYAKNEKDLRKSLISLDYSSKYVGLFPQTSKIDIRQVKNVLEEIKTLSDPPEPEFTNPSPDQVIIHKRINTLSQRLNIQDETRFKFTVSRALPRSNQSKRLLKILIKYPHLYPTILNYFSRYTKIPLEISDELYKILQNDDPPYFSLQSELLRNTFSLINVIHKPQFIKFCEMKWQYLKDIKHAEDYRKSLMLWLIKEKNLTYNKLSTLFLSNERDEWFKARVLLHVDKDFIGDPSYTALLNNIIRNYEGDLSFVACYLMLKHNCNMRGPRNTIKHLPSAGLLEFGLIRSTNSPVSEIPRCLKEITNANLPSFDWKKELGNQHKNIQNKFIINLGYIKTDATGWIMSLDVIMDNLLNLLTIHDSSIGACPLGNIGGFIRSTKSQFAQKFPLLHKVCNEIHDYRKYADLAHPIHKITRKTTRRIEFSVIKKLQPSIYNGLNEMITLW